MRSCLSIILITCLFVVPAWAAEHFSWQIAGQKNASAAEGVEYVKYFVKTSRGGMHVHTVQIEPLASYALMPVIANGRLNTVAPVSKLARQVGAVAAINGGFFDTGKTRLPVGLIKIQDRVIFEQFLNRAVLGIDEHGALHFETFKLKSFLEIPELGVQEPIYGYNRPRKEGELVIYTPEFGGYTRTNEWGAEVILNRAPPNRTDLPFVLDHVELYLLSSVNHLNSRIPSDGAVLSIHKSAMPRLNWLDQAKLGMPVRIVTNMPEGWDSFPYVLGGGPLLVKGGHSALNARKEGFGAYFRKPNARTAVGRTNSGRSIIVVIDRMGSSGGATWEEMATLFQDLLHCSDAMGFDGGGSSTMFVGDTVVNTPAGGAQRSVANILAVVPFETFM